MDYLGNVDILGSLTIQGSDAGERVYLMGVGVAKNLTMKLGDSIPAHINHVILQRNVTEAASNFIGGKLSMTGGDGKDVWFIGETTITGSAQFKLGETPAGQTDRLTIDNSTIQGAVKITSGDGLENIDVLNSTLSSFSLQLKDGIDIFLGDDHVKFSSTTITGNVKISASNDCLIEILGNSEVFGNLSIRAKDLALLGIDDSSVTGKVNVSSGTYAGFYLSLSASITGDVAVKAKERGQLSLYDTSIIEGNAKLSGGSGQDSFSLNAGCEITGSVKINFRTQDGLQSDIVGILGHIGGDLSVTGGNGREYINLSGATIDGNLKLDLKDATVAGVGSRNDVNIVASVVAGDVSIRSKGKIEAILIRSQIDGTFNMKLGKAADKVEIEDCVFGGSFILDTSHGSDTLDIDWTGTVGSNFFGTVTVKMGNDDDNVSVGDIAGVGAGATFHYKCSFDGGSGADWFYALNPAYGNNFLFGVPNYTNFENVF